ncbi:hypothetical protein ACFRLW_27985, partial [Streptomyces sp. NPDC056728]
MGDDENRRAKLLVGAARGRELDSGTVRVGDTVTPHHGRHPPYVHEPPPPGARRIAASQGVARRPRSGLDSLELPSHATPMGRTLRWSVR